MGRKALTENEKKDRKLLRILNSYKRESHVTHAQVAKRAGCSEQLVSYVLNGHSDMTVRMLRIMVDEYGVPLEELRDCI